MSQFGGNKQDIEYVASTAGDSHRIVNFGLLQRILNTSKKRVRICGTLIDNADFFFEADSDGDVGAHAIIRALSMGIGFDFLGPTATRLCKEEGVTDSMELLRRALEYLPENVCISALSLYFECKKPKIGPHIDSMKKNLSLVLNIPTESIGITASTGEGLTQFGRGKGVSAIATVTFAKRVV